jgi:hypothetical protein
MRVPLRVSIGIWLGLICLASGLMAWRWFDYRYGSAESAAPGPNAVRRVPVTVVSVADLPADSARPGNRVRVCFSIDSFAGIPASDRSYYETHERARQAAKGPLCLDEARGAATRPGDRLMLSFTLENGGAIAPRELTVDGHAVRP